MLRCKLVLRDVAFQDTSVLSTILQQCARFKHCGNASRMYRLASLISLLTCSLCASCSLLLRRHVFQGVHMLLQFISALAL
jgi:hypothetical protein